MSSEQPQESLHQMKMRHKKEMQELQKAGAKGKGGKKDLEKKVAELKAKQDAEVEQFQKVKSPQPEPVAPTPGAGEEEIPEEKKEKKPSKAQKRKANKAARDSENRRQIEESVKDMVDVKAVEAKKLNAKLDALKLSVKEVAADGHCLFRAVGDQLDLHTSSLAALRALSLSSSSRHMALRQLAANHMLAHPDEFAPFLTNADGDMLTPEEYKQYCARLCADSSSAVMWGGQPEIVALAAALGVRISVHAADSEPIVMGADSAQDTLHISYHRHYYGLGEHYNSVVPARARPVEDGDDEDEEAEDGGDQSDA